MNKVSQAFALTAITLGSLNASGAFNSSNVEAAPAPIEQGIYTIPSTCEVLNEGRQISKETERALVRVGFSGINVDGRISNPKEQGAILGAQKFMQQIGVLADVKVCGNPGPATKKAAETMLYPGDLAGESQISETRSTANTVSSKTCATIKLSPWVAQRIPGSDGDTVLDNGKEARALQEALNRNGVAVGTADGIFGNKSLRGFADYQQQKFGYVDCLLGSQTYPLLGIPEESISSSNAEFSPAVDCPRASSCDIKINLDQQRVSIVQSDGDVVWDIPTQSGKLGKESRIGSGKLGPVEYGPNKNPERYSVDYPEAVLVLPRSIGNGGQKLHGSYSFNAGAVNNKKVGSAGCYRLSIADSHIMAEMPTGTDVIVTGQKPGTVKRYF